MTGFTDRTSQGILGHITGKASIAYLPKDRVVGISKLARVLHGFARSDLRRLPPLASRVRDMSRQGVSP